MSRIAAHTYITTVCIKRCRCLWISSVGQDYLKWINLKVDYLNHRKCCSNIVSILMFHLQGRFFHWKFTCIHVCCTPMCTIITPSVYESHDLNHWPTDCLIHCVAVGAFFFTTDKLIRNLKSHLSLSIKLTEPVLLLKYKTKFVE